MVVHLGGKNMHFLGQNMIQELPWGHMFRIQSSGGLCLVWLLHISHSSAPKSISHSSAPKCVHQRWPGLFPLLCVYFLVKLGRHHCWQGFLDSENATLRGHTKISILLFGVWGICLIHNHSWELFWTTLSSMSNAPNASLTAPWMVRIATGKSLSITICSSNRFWTWR